MAERDFPRMRYLQMIANGIAWPFLDIETTYRPNSGKSEALPLRVRRGCRMEAEPASTAIINCGILPSSTFHYCQTTTRRIIHEQESSDSTIPSRTKPFQDAPVHDAPVDAPDDVDHDRFDIKLDNARACDGDGTTPKIINWLVDSIPIKQLRHNSCTIRPSNTTSDQSLHFVSSSSVTWSSPSSPSASSAAFPLCSFWSVLHPVSSSSSSSLSIRSPSSPTSSHSISVSARPEVKAVITDLEMPLRGCRAIDLGSRITDDDSDARSSTAVPLDFQCHMCLKRYSSVGAARLHARTHTLPCRCPACGKAFSRPWLLRGHWRTHTGERPFQCPDPGCRRAFADRSNLRAHLQTHAAVKKYCCGRCPKTFSRVSLLVKHKRTCCA